MTFDREELLSALADASPALARTSTIPGLDHFWFDGDFVYAYDGGLGVRVAFKSELECGLPGKALLDLLKTSALKQVDMSFDKSDVVIAMGRSKINVVSLDNARSAWAFPLPGKKTTDAAQGILVLSEAVLEAITRVSFARLSGKATRVVENGVTVVPQKSTVEFYATDSASLARTLVKEKVDQDMPRFVAPWAFVDRFLELAEPGAKLLVMEDCLMVESKGVLICSNLLELPDDPDLPKAMAPHLRDKEDEVVELPLGLQSVLDRAMILSGQEEAVVTFTAEGKLLVLEGRYGLGHLEEELPVKGKMPEVTAKFPAHLVRRALGQAKTIMLSSKAMVLDDGVDFVYVLAANAAKAERASKRKADEDKPAARRQAKPTRELEEDNEEEPTTTRRRRRVEADGDEPF